MADVEQAAEILKEYTGPGPMIDSGNLFFAACEYQKAYEEVKKELAMVVDSHGRQRALNDKQWEDKKELIQALRRADELYADDAGRTKVLKDILEKYGKT